MFSLLINYWLCLLCLCVMQNKISSSSSSHWFFATIRGARYQQPFGSDAVRSAVVSLLNPRVSWTPRILHSSQMQRHQSALDWGTYCSCQLRGVMGWGSVIQSHYATKERALHYVTYKRKVAKRVIGTTWNARLKNSARNCRVGNACSVFLFHFPVSHSVTARTLRRRTTSN